MNCCEIEKSEWQECVGVFYVQRRRQDWQYIISFPWTLHIEDHSAEPHVLDQHQWRQEDHFPAFHALVVPFYPHAAGHGSLTLNEHRTHCRQFSPYQLRLNVTFEGLSIPCDEVVRKLK